MLLPGLLTFGFDASAPALLLRTTQQLRQRHHLVPTYFIYSDNHVLRLLPRCSARRTIVETFSAGPSNADAWLGPSTLYVRYWQHRCVRSSLMRCWV